MKASISADSFPGRAFSGWVGFISSVAEFTPKAVETVELRSSLVYEIRVFVQDPQDEMRLGMPATVASGIKSARPEPTIGKVSSKCRGQKLSGAWRWPVMVGVGGCAVGPDYHPPPVHAPAAWSSPMANGLTNSAAAASTWWNSFNDPELDSLIQRAAQSNLDLRVAEARLRQARAVRERSAADFMPSVDASASYARQLQSENQPLIGALPLPPNFPFEYNVYQAGFDASWEIDLFGGKRRALEAATAEWEGTIEARNDAMVSLLAEVARNYVELRGGQCRLEIARRNLKLQEEALELTRARFQTGVANELDVTRAAALLAGIRAAIPPLEYHRAERHVRHSGACSARNRANW